MNIVGLDGKTVTPEQVTKPTPATFEIEMLDGEVFQKEGHLVATTAFLAIMNDQGQLQTVVPIDQVRLADRVNEEQVRTEDSQSA